MVTIFFKVLYTFYLVSLRLIVTIDIEKNITIKPLIRARAQRRSELNSPLNNALVMRTTGVNGATQLRFWIVTGKEESGKNTPLKKNIGVIKRVKK